MSKKRAPFFISDRFNFMKSCLLQGKSRVRKNFNQAIQQAFIILALNNYQLIHVYKKLGIEINDNPLTLYLNHVKFTKYDYNNLK